MNAVGRVRRATQLTLSDITVNAIFDRVHFQSKNLFPILNKFKFEPDGSILWESNRHLAAEDPAMISDAFEHLLVEVLTVIHNLTSGLLTDRLYQELLKAPIANKPDGEAK